MKFKLLILLSTCFFSFHVQANVLEDACKELKNLMENGGLKEEDSSLNYKPKGIGFNDELKLSDSVKDGANNFAAPIKILAEQLEDSVQLKSPRIVITNEGKKGKFDPSLYIQKGDQWVEIPILNLGNFDQIMSFGPPENKQKQVARFNLENSYGTIHFRVILDQFDPTTGSGKAMIFAMDEKGKSQLCLSSKKEAKIHVSIRNPLNKEVYTGSNEKGSKNVQGILISNPPPEAVSNDPDSTGDERNISGSKKSKKEPRKSRATKGE